MRTSFVFLLLFFVSVESHGWGKRGHALICETGAYLASSQSLVAGHPTRFLKQHSLDFGYYCNVPDLIWKRPATYKKEFTNHFMNLEAFQREFDSKVFTSKDSPFRLSRKEFNSKNKNIPTGKGRSWWRIQELYKTLEETTSQLKKTKLTKKQKQDLQAKWLFTAGVMGHYVGDLAMPLHVSENYDGQLSGQKGLHHYFEEKMVSELFLTDSLGLQGEVYKRALKRWPKFSNDNKNKDLLNVIYDLSMDSQKQVPKLLAIDKKTGRKNLKKSMAAHKELVIERLVQGSLYQGLVYYRNLGWEYNGKEFFHFNERPEFIKPPK